MLDNNKSDTSYFYQNQMYVADDNYSPKIIMEDSLRRPLVFTFVIPRFIFYSVIRIVVNTMGVTFHFEIITCNCNKVYW